MASFATHALMASMAMRPFLISLTRRDLSSGDFLSARAGEEEWGARISVLLLLSAPFVYFDEMNSKGGPFRWLQSVSPPTHLEAAVALREPEGVVPIVPRHAPPFVVLQFERMGEGFEWEGLDGG